MNAIPIIGWLISIVLNTSLALPFWIVWTKCGIGEKYAYWLPDIYHTPGFWACVGMFISMEIIKQVFVPKIMSSSQTNNNK